MIKTSFNTKTEMKFKECRFYFRSKQLGMPENKNRCFICGIGKIFVENLCKECYNEFPTKENHLRFLATVPGERKKQCKN